MGSSPPAVYVGVLLSGFAPRFAEKPSGHYPFKIIQNGLQELGSERHKGAKYAKWSNHRRSRPKKLENMTEWHGQSWRLKLWTRFTSFHHVSTSSSDFKGTWKKWWWVVPIPQKSTSPCERASQSMPLQNPVMLGPKGSPYVGWNNTAKWCELNFVWMFLVDLSIIYLHLRWTEANHLSDF